MKSHRTDGVSLTFAILFLGIVAVWLLSQVVDMTLPGAGWLVAGALIVFGVLGLLGTLRAGRRPATDEPVSGAGRSSGSSRDDPC